MWSPIVEVLNTDKERIDKRITNDDLIEKLSGMYRLARKTQDNIKDTMWELSRELSDKNITHYRYLEVSEKISQLNKEIDRLENYSNGIFDARELLL